MECQITNQENLGAVKSPKHNQTCPSKTSVYFSCDSSKSCNSEAKSSVSFLSKTSDLMRKANVSTVPMNASTRGNTSNGNFCKYNVGTPPKKQGPIRRSPSSSVSKPSFTSSSEYFTTASSLKSSNYDNWPQWVNATPSLADYTATVNSASYSFTGNVAERSKEHNSKFTTKNQNTLRLLQLSTTYSYIPKQGSQIRTFTIPSNDGTPILMESNNIRDALNKSYASPEILRMNATMQDHPKVNFVKESPQRDCKTDFINFDYSSTSDHVKIPSMSITSYFK